MSTTVNIRVNGLVELQHKLDQLKSSRAKAVIRKAIAKASRPLVRAMKSLAPIGPTKNLRRSISFRPKTYRGGELLMSVIGPKWPMGAHAHLVEFGHRIVTKSGRDTGKRTQPHPFMRPAWDANKDQLLRDVKEAIGAGIEREAKRA